MQRNLRHLLRLIASADLGLAADVHVASAVVDLLLQLLLQDVDASSQHVNDVDVEIVND